MGASVVRTVHTKTDPTGASRRGVASRGASRRNRRRFVGMVSLGLNPESDFAPRCPLRHWPEGGSAFSFKKQSPRDETDSMCRLQTHTDQKSTRRTG